MCWLIVLLLLWMPVRCSGRAVHTKRRFRGLAQITVSPAGGDLRPASSDHAVSIAIAVFPNIFGDLPQWLRRALTSTGFI
ncbi:MAG TPA: hypothetical protein VK607_27075 [Kofleriaceae bacterium]|nr:hypothetical protein [Kofleriaceae bacterium]